ncbi:hypothetical protein BASA82_000356 [Batrachochytrium salamandrivorans]|nr:hypothetical protein BASA82_000356 [Batrachochytrium salamandrivorans]
MATRIVEDQAGERCIEVDLDAVAKHLMCDTCNRLLVDAMTLTECAHTFCEACILLKNQAAWDWTSLSKVSYSRDLGSAQA